MKDSITKGLNSTLGKPYLDLMLTLILWTLVRVAPYLFFDRNENVAVRDKSTVCSVDCAVV